MRSKDETGRQPVSCTAPSSSTMTFPCACSSELRGKNAPYDGSSHMGCQADADSTHHSDCNNQQQQVITTKRTRKRVTITQPDTPPDPEHAHTRVMSCRAESKRIGGETLFTRSHTRTKRHAPPAGPIKKGPLVLSEYPLGAPARKFNHFFRALIVSTSSCT